MRIPEDVEAKREEKAELLVDFLLLDRLCALFVGVVCALFLHCTCILSLHSCCGRGPCAIETYDRGAWVDIIFYFFRLNLREHLGGNLATSMSPSGHESSDLHRLSDAERCKSRTTHELTKPLRATHKNITVGVSVNGASFAL